MELSKVSGMLRGVIALCLFSRKFLAREQSFSTVKKECLAIKLGIEALRLSKCIF